MNENNVLENIKNIGTNTLKSFDKYLGTLSKKDKYISSIEVSISEVLEHLITGVVNLANGFEKKITLSEDKKKQYQVFLQKKYNPTTDITYANKEKLIKSIADIFKSFKNKIDDQEVVTFIINYIDAFHVKELILNNYIYYHHLFDDRELTIKNFIEHLVIFPHSHINEAAIDGNHRGGYLEINSFDFNLQDKLIRKFLELNIDNTNLLIMLLRYRIACENWLFHCQILNNLWNILKNDGKPSPRPIDKKLKDPLIYNYAYDKHFLNVAKKALLWGVPRFVLYLLTLFIFPIFGLFVSNNINIIILCWSLIIAFAVQQIYYNLGSKRREEKIKQKLVSLSLRDDMFYLSFDVEGKSLHDDVGHFEGLDTEEIIRKIRELRNKHASYPVELIALLRKEVDKGNYVLRLKRS